MKNLEQDNRIRIILKQQILIQKLEQENQELKKQLSFQPLSLIQKEIEKAIKHKIEFKI